MGIKDWTIITKLLIVWLTCTRGHTQEQNFNSIGTNDRRPGPIVSAAYGQRAPRPQFQQYPPPAELEPNTQDFNGDMDRVDHPTHQAYLQPPAQYPVFEYKDTRPVDIIPNPETQDSSYPPGPYSGYPPAKHRSAPFRRGHPRMSPGLKTGTRHYTPVKAPSAYSTPQKSNRERVPYVPVHAQPQRSQMRHGPIIPGHAFSPKHHQTGNAFRGQFQDAFPSRQGVQVGSQKDHRQGYHEQARHSLDSPYPQPNLQRSDQNIQPQQHMSKQRRQQNPPNRQHQQRQRHHPHQPFPFQFQSEMRHQRLESQGQRPKEGPPQPLPVSYRRHLQLQMEEAQIGDSNGVEPVDMGYVASEPINNNIGMTSRGSLIHDREHQHIHRNYDQHQEQLMRISAHEEDDNERNLDGEGIVSAQITLHERNPGRIGSTERDSGRSGFSGQYSGPAVLTRQNVGQNSLPGTNPSTFTGQGASKSTLSEQDANKIVFTRGAVDNSALADEGSLPPAPRQGNIDQTAKTEQGATRTPSTGHQAARTTLPRRPWGHPALKEHASQRNKPKEQHFSQTDLKALYGLMNLKEQNVGKTSLTDQGYGPTNSGEHDPDGTISTEHDGAKAVLKVVHTTLPYQAVTPSQQEAGTLPRVLFNRGEEAWQPIESPPEHKRTIKKQDGSESDMMAKKTGQNTLTIQGTAQDRSIRENADQNVMTKKGHQVTPTEQNGAGIALTERDDSQNTFTEQTVTDTVLTEQDAANTTSTKQRANHINFRGQDLDPNTLEVQYAGRTNLTEQDLADTTLKDGDLDQTALREQFNSMNTFTVQTTRRTALRVRNVSPTGPTKIHADQTAIIEEHASKASMKEDGSDQTTAVYEDVGQSPSIEQDPGWTVSRADSSVQSGISGDDTDQNTLTEKNPGWATLKQQDIDKSSTKKHNSTLNTLGDQGTARTDLTEEDEDQTEWSALIEQGERGSISTTQDYSQSALVDAVGRRREGEQDMSALREKDTSIKHRAGKIAAEAKEQDPGLNTSTEQGAEKTAISEQELTDKDADENQGNRRITFTESPTSMHGQARTIPEHETSTLASMIINKMSEALQNVVTGSLLSPGFHPRNTYISQREQSAKDGQAPNVLSRKDVSSVKKHSDSEELDKQQHLVPDDSRTRAKTQQETYPQQPEGKRAVLERPMSPPVNVWVSETELNAASVSQDNTTELSRDLMFAVHELNPEDEGGSLIESHFSNETHQVEPTPLRGKPGIVTSALKGDQTGGQQGDQDTGGSGAEKQKKVILSVPLDLAPSAISLAWSAIRSLLMSPTEGPVEKDPSTTTRLQAKLSREGVAVHDESEGSGLDEADEWTVLLSRGGVNHVQYNNNNRNLAAEQNPSISEKSSAGQTNKRHVSDLNGLTQMNGDAVIHFNIAGRKKRFLRISSILKANRKKRKKSVHNTGLRPRRSQV